MYSKKFLNRISKIDKDKNITPQQRFILTIVAGLEEWNFNKSFDELYKEYRASVVK